MNIKDTLEITVDLDDLVEILGGLYDETELPSGAVLRRASRNWIELVFGEFVDSASAWAEGSITVKDVKCIARQWRESLQVAREEIREDMAAMAAEFAADQ